MIETENATIQVDPSRSDLVEMKQIDGRMYVLIAIEGEATVNRVEVNIPFKIDVETISCKAILPVVN